VPAVAYLGLLIWLLTQLGPWAITREEYPVFMVLLVAMVLPTVLVRAASKRGRLHVFESDQAKRNGGKRWWAETVPVAMIFLGGCLILNRMLPRFLEQGGVVFMIGLPTSIMGLLEQRYRVRARHFESGWFALANVEPAAIARLAEIQNRLGQPPLSRKPS
jgi:hypothetical protein